MRLKRLIIEFLMLSPVSSILMLIFTILLGILHSLSFLALMPLMKYLGVLGNESSNTFFIRYFDKMIEWLGLDNSLVSVLIFMVLLMWSISGIGYFITAYSAKVSARITRDLREQFFNSIIKAKWFYFVKKQTGSVIHSVITETQSTVRGYQLSIQTCSNSIQSIILLITTFMVSPLISMFALLVGIIFIIIFNPWLAYAKGIGRRTGVLLQSITSRITDGLLGLKPIKAMNSDRFLIPILRHETIELEKEQVKSFMVSQLPTVIRDSTVILIVALGTYSAIQYSLIPLVSLIPMIFLFRTAIGKLGTTQSITQKLKEMEPFLISLKKNIGEINRIGEKWEGFFDPIFNDSITINNLNFSYPTRSVLSDVSIVIQKNSFIALMGESGAGKTTFSDILCALFTPDSGEVLVDGRNLFYELDIKKWRRMIGYVPQDLFLFHDTIMKNVTLGDSEIREEDVVRALKDAGAWEFVSELPERMNTVIGERGIRLSGGQRQRLSIARAVVRKPQLLILDEATTALDPKTEEKILRTLRQLTDKGITIVAVSHQTAVLDIADDVYRLAEGRFEKVEKKEKVGT